MEQVFNTKNYKETQKAGEEFAKKLKAGDVICLYGELGSGKTTFVQGLAEGLGLKQRIVSPTFIIVRQYKLSSMYTVSSIKYFYHIDLYRIESEQEIEGLGLKEILGNSENITAIEWAEKIESLLPRKRIDIYFEYLGEDERKIRMQSY